MVVVSDGGDEGEDASCDPDAHAGDGAAAGEFEVELAIEVSPTNSMSCRRG